MFLLVYNTAMKDFITLVQERHSVRSYTERKVEKEKVDLILEAGRLAPTGCNRQGEKLYAVSSPEGLEKLGKAANTYEAPMAVVVAMKKDGSWVRPYDGKDIIDIDASIITDHMMMEAADLGLGSCWVCNFKSDILSSGLSIPEEYVPVNILLIGYEKDGKYTKSRKTLSEIVEYR